MSNLSVIPQSTITLVHDPKTHDLRLKRHPTPSPSSTQYVIEVKATTFTAGELLWPEPNGLQDPIPGFDVAGVVLATPTESNSRVDYYPPGTRVFGLTSFSRHGNSRGITVAEHSELARIPNGLNFTDAASIPLSALTAWQALFHHAGLRAEEGANRDTRVLITAASGGVGTWAVQISKWAGAHVVGTCSSANAAMVRALGATEVLDYNEIIISEWVRNQDERYFDVVLDCVGAKTLEKCWTTVKEGGLLISITEPPEHRKPSEGVQQQVGAVFYIVAPNGEQVEMIAGLVTAGKLKTMVDGIWELRNWEGALDKVKGGHVSGKVVLKVED